MTCVATKCGFDVRITIMQSWVKYKPREARQWVQDLRVTEEVLANIGEHRQQNVLQTLQALAIVILFSTEVKVPVLVLTLGQLVAVQPVAVQLVTVQLVTVPLLVGKLLSEQVVSKALESN